MSQTRQTVSIPKAVELVGVSRRTIYNWIAAGKVDYVRTAGGSLRIFVDTLFRGSDGQRLAPGDERAFIPDGQAVQVEG